MIATSSVILSTDKLEFFVVLFIISIILFSPRSDSTFIDLYLIDNPLILDFTRYRLKLIGVGDGVSTGAFLCIRTLFLREPGFEPTTSRSLTDLQASLETHNLL